LRAAAPSARKRVSASRRIPQALDDAPNGELGIK
jgi:hypothetical protein